MNKKFKVKMIVDFCIQVLLLLLMSYALIGEETHEWLGIGMGILVLIHNMLNLLGIKIFFEGNIPYYV